MGLLQSLIREIRGTLSGRKPAADADECAADPRLHNLAEVMSESARSLVPLYDEYVYVDGVSTSVMAVSFEAAALLDALCRILEPRNVVDLGSGFSSVVVRRYARDAKNCLAGSVDDDPAWLARTQSFLVKLGLPTDHLMSWTDFQNTSQRYDLIFHDLGNMLVREQSLPVALNRVSPGGMVILDDMHKQDYAVAAQQIVRAAGFTLVPLRETTRDQYDRHACLAIPGEDRRPARSRSWAPKRSSMHSW
jgi:predicted O-methyltransferase YrrM